MFRAFVLLAAAAEERARTTSFPLLSMKRCSFSVRYTVKGTRTSHDTRPHFGRFAVYESNLLIARKETRAYIDAHTSGPQTSNSSSRGLTSWGISGSYAEFFVSRVLRATGRVISFAAAELFRRRKTTKTKASPCRAMYFPLSFVRSARLTAQAYITYRAYATSCAGV